MNSHESQLANSSEMNEVSNQYYPNPVNIINIKCANYLFKTLVLIDPLDIQEGMMGKAFSQHFQGALFLFGDGFEGYFWTKNCIIPLDIIYLKNGKINKIHHNCPPCLGECRRYKGTGDMVLEIYGGLANQLGIKPGMRIELVA